MTEKDIITLAVSITALTFSILSTLYSIFNKKNEERRGIRREISENLRRILDIQKDIMSNFFEAKRENRLVEHQQTSAAINQQIATLARQVVFLDLQAPDIASDVEYATLAGALAAVSDPTADEYWRKAIGRASIAYYKVANTRGYADYLFNTGRAKEGREKYEQALKLLPGEDDWTRYTDGWTLRMWGVSERGIDEHAQAEQVFARAQAAFEKISRPQMRAFALNDLAGVRAGAFDFTLPAHDPPGESSRPTAARA